MAQKHRFALCVGINKYTSPRVTSLNECKRDAVDMHGALKQSSFDSDFELDTSKADLEQAIDAFSAKIRADKDAFVIFSFSGHGATSPFAPYDQYLMCSDAEPPRERLDDEPQEEYDSEVHQNLKKYGYKVPKLLEKLQSATKLVAIFDTCRVVPSRDMKKPLLWTNQYRFIHTGSNCMVVYTCQLGGKASDAGSFTQRLAKALAAKENTLYGAISVASDLSANQVPRTVVMMPGLFENIYLFKDDGSNVARDTPTGSGVDQRQLPRLQTTTYIVKSGDSLSKIAHAQKVKLEDLLAANLEIEDPDVIYPGDRILVPVPKSNY